MTNIGVSKENILRIFERISNLNVLLKNYQQSEGLVQLLENTFMFGEKTFVIYNFNDEESFQDWVQHCKDFRSNSLIRTLYYERLYLKTHEPKSAKTSLDFFEDFEPHKTVPDQDCIDSQSPDEEPRDKLSESFAQSLDRWFTLRQSGFILFCSFSELEMFLGCLLNRSGTFFIIIEENSYTKSVRENVSTILKTAWKTSGNLKVFVFIFQEIYVLNPFEFDENWKSFGALEKLSNVNVNPKLNNLNSYPMNVEIFDSTYSKHESQRNFPGKLGSFIGPDVQVARFIQSQMNISRNWSKKLIKIAQSSPFNASFSSVVTLVKNQDKFGEKLSNGTLTGALGNLQKRKSDIALTAFFMKVINVSSIIRCSG